MTTTLTVIVFFLRVASVMCVCPSTVHPHVRGFGPGCRYRCNCKYNEQCDLATGECPHGCLQGWMGPACQYRNLAAFLPKEAILQNPSQSDTIYDAMKAVDLDDTTCSRTGFAQGQRWVILDLRALVYLVGFVIKIPRVQQSHFRGFSVEVGNNTHTWSLCYRHDISRDGNVRMEVACVKPLIGRYVQISLAKGETRDLSLCELEIFGGRLVSFNKPSSMDSTYTENGLWKSSYAVDGRVPLSYEHQSVQSERTCAATDVSNYIAVTHRWWLIDLGTIYSIQGFSFFGRHEVAYQFKGFIATRSTDGVAYNELFTDSNPVESPTFYHPMSANFSWPVSGRYIQVNKYNAYILAVCEFEVFADCPFGLCGWECNETCMCSSQTTGTNKILGTCPHGCSGRWTGLNGKCNIECDVNHWGPLCERTCGYCMESCDVVNGTCPGSCQPLYQPPYCTQVCPDGRYGTDCLYTCGNCRDNTFCDKVTGQCTSGCKPGYKAPYCKEMCGSYTYGDNCANFCGNCRMNDVCNHVNGTCPRGCALGYQGETCKTIPSSDETLKAHSEILDFLKTINRTVTHMETRLYKLDDINQTVGNLKSELQNYEQEKANFRNTSVSEMSNRLKLLEVSVDVIHDEIKDLRDILSLLMRNSSTSSNTEEDND